MFSGWETYNGKKYLLLRYNKLTLDQLKSEVNEVLAEVSKYPVNSILCLVDVNDTIISPATFEVLQGAASKYKQYLKRAAVLGVTGVRRNMLDLLIKFTGMELTAFDKKEDALNWLMQAG